MIEKIYEISCDNCSHSINHTFYKPTIKDLKRSVFKLLDIAEEYGIKGFVDDGDKVILDKFAITEDKEGKKVKVILNGKYHNKDNKDNKEVKQINCDNIRYSFNE